MLQVPNREFDFRQRPGHRAAPNCHTSFTPASSWAS